MNNKLPEPRRHPRRKAAWHPGNSMPDELLAFCPACKALEVMRFSGESPALTPRFVEKSGEVYHACGSDVPCRLYSLVGNLGHSRAGDMKMQPSPGAQKEDILKK